MKVQHGAFKLVPFAVSVVWLATVAFMSPQNATTKVNFSRDVLPILSDKCFKCHGPDSESRMANLRLDTSQGAFAERNGRWPIVPGKPQDSLILKRIHDKSSPMPPEYSGKKLSKAEIDTLTKWIAEGAQYGKIWSFELLPKKVSVPKVAGNWPKNDIDRFILARLTREKLKPSPPADRHRWLRRVTYDLTGLPPSESEIAAFLGDTRPDAYEKVVDRLLASPHFGERMAVDWLDAARYSDSYGYQSDLIMPTWPYRDWVVKSFNQNLPYDRFLIDQIAGDLLPSPTRDEKLATAFNRLHRQSNEGGSIALEFKTEYAVDRVSTFGTAVLGLTLGCARCHDHKFDPITQREFYQLYAYFNSIDEYGLLLSTEIVPTPSLLLPTPEQETKLKELQANNKKALSELSKVATEASPRYEAWVAKRSTALASPDILAKISLDKFEGGKFANGAGGAAFGTPMGNVQLVPGHDGQAALLDGENGIVVKGLPDRERWDAFTWSLWIEDPRSTTEPIVLMHRTGGTDVGFCGFDLILEDGFLTARVMRHWPGNAVAVRTRDRVAKNEWSHVAWSWDGSGRTSGLKIYLNGKPAQTTVVADKIWKKINAYGDLGPSGGEWAFGQRFRDLGFKGGKIDDLVFADRELSPIEVAQLFDDKTLSSATNLKEFYLATIDEPMKAAREEVKKAQIALANHEETIYEISVMEESAKPIPAYLLARGRYDAPRTATTMVKRDVPKSLPPLKVNGANNRLALAKWVTQPDHPLTARVAVNRLWQICFGTGLVETSENFGVQGDRPTHPELLDYLARKFVDSGWNVKSLLREVVLSATYRQDSARPKNGMDPDPHNRLYSRGPSERLSAEMVRDTALAASGLMVGKIGGPPVNPYQPAGIWTENNTMSPQFVQSKGEGLYRRSIYSTVKRTTPMPSMLMFDATSREACTVRRPATNTPLQALVLLNDVQFVEACRTLAERVLKLNLSDSDRIRTAFRRFAGRDPDAVELGILSKTLKEQTVQFESDPASAEKLIKEGDSKADPSLKPVNLAAMTVTIQVILNSDAVIWKR